MTEIKLKPCPFCGKEVITAVSVIHMDFGDNIRFAVYCPACHVGQYSEIVDFNTFEETEKTMKKAIEAWNRMAENDQRTD